MPYSDSTTIRVPSRRAAAISSPQSASTARRSPRDRGMTGPEPLEVVVEMRQVDERERGPLGLVDVARAVGDPPARREVGRRAPEPEERELAQARVQLVAELGGLRVDVRDLPAVGGVHRAWRDRPRRRAVHVVPPEELGARERGIPPAGRVPDLLARHEPVRLAPEPDLRQIVEVPAVGDDAVVAGEEPGGERGLHRARDGGDDRPQRPGCALAREGGKARGRLADEVAGQADDQKDDRPVHGGRAGRAGERRQTGQAPG